MSIKVIVINLVTLIFVCGTLYFAKETKTFDSLLTKRDNVVLGIKGTVAGGVSGISNLKDTIVQKTITKSTPTQIEKKSDSQVVTPGPLEIKTTSNVSKNGSVNVSGVIERTNYERNQNMLPKLLESLELDMSAQIKANDILKRQYFEHTAPDGKTVSDLVAISKYQYVRVGENLALGEFSDNLDLVTAWMNSPGHRANILDRRYQDIGIGIAYGNYKGRNVIVAVQHFGRPRSSCPSVDDKLKDKISALEAQASKISGALDLLKVHIDTMRANSEYVDNTVINAFNKSVTQYESIIDQQKSLRDEYNVEVRVFNACISSL